MIHVSYFYLGTTYRTREEVGGVRQTKDPIEYVKNLLIDSNFATADEIKILEKQIRNEVQDALTKAKADTFPTVEHLYQDIYANKDLKNDPQPYIRMPDYAKSIRHST